MSFPVVSALPVGRSLLYLVVAGVAWGTAARPRP
ncbi:membrane protein [Streptomyces badius]